MGGTVLTLTLPLETMLLIGDVGGLLVAPLSLRACISA